MSLKTFYLKINGMTCAHCAQSITDALHGEGIVECQIDHQTGDGIIVLDSAQTNLDRVVSTIYKLGYQVTEVKTEDKSTTGTFARKHLVIIGGGSAAFAAALKANELGARVTMINGGSLPIGGTCVNAGCVPSKTLIRAAEALHKTQRTQFAGIETNGRLSSFNAVMEQKQALVEQLRQQKYQDVIRSLKNFEFVEGLARFTDSHTVQVGNRTIRGDFFLIATGARAALPAIPGLDSVPYLTSQTIFNLNFLPKSLIVLGGNYIGLEIAQTFARFGSQVRVVELQAHILPQEDLDVAETLQTYLAEDGIEFFTSAVTKRVWQENDRIFLEVEINGQTIELNASHFLVATGRKANVETLNLNVIGVKSSKQGFVEVNRFLQTAEPHIFAAGDVIGAPMFVYTAAYEGQLAATNALSSEMVARDYNPLPWVIFTDPQVAGVGLDETQAKEQGLLVEVARLDLTHVPRALAARDTRGFIKLLRDPKTDRLLGARIVAPEGGELLMELVLAIKFGMTVEELKEMFHPYLTLSEGIKLAAITFSKDVEQLSCCAT